MAWTYVTGDAKRKDFAVAYIIGVKSMEEALALTKEKVELIGKGIDDMPISFSAETEETQDVLGNNNYEIVAYAPSMSVDPLKVTGESKYAQFIDEAFEKQATLGELHVFYLCFKRYKTNEAGAFRAWVQEGVVELADFASGLNGVSMSHTVHYVGERVLGALTVSDDAMSFVKDDTADATEL